jgi:ABC-type branched-subunit amino acid transport system ATPase component
MESVLKAVNLGIAFGGLKAVQHFNIDIKEGELVGLIGPNGAGKTTVFNLLTASTAHRGQCSTCAAESQRQKDP